jgi:hypothetical protein
MKAAKQNAVFELLQHPCFKTGAWAPKCPECGRKMHYEDDRDEAGNLTQSPWWECTECIVSIAMVQPNTP